MAENGGRPSLSAQSVASSTYQGIWWSKETEEMVSAFQQMMAKQTRELQASIREVAEQTQQLRGCVEKLERSLSAKGAAEEGPSAKGGAEEQGGHKGEQDVLREMVHLNPDRPLLEDGAPELGGWPVPSGRLEEHRSPDGLRGCVEELVDGLRGSSSQTQQPGGCVKQLEGYLSAKGAAEEGPSTRGGDEEQGGHEGEQDRPEAARDVKVTNNARAHVKLWLDSLSRMLGGKDGPRGMITNDLDSDRIPDAPQDGTEEHNIFDVQDLRTPPSPQPLDRRESFSGSGWCRAQCKKMKKRSGLCVVGMSLACAFLGFEANAIMTSSDFSMPDSFLWPVARWFIALAFLVELAIRWVADGCEFLRPRRNEEFGWNLFDTLLTLSIFANAALYAFSIQRVALLRVTHITGLHIRLLRVTRLHIRLLRAPLLKELNMMITGLLRCVRPLFWAGVLLFGLTYMMGIIVSQLIAEEFHKTHSSQLIATSQNTNGDHDLHDGDHDDLHDGDERFLRYITKHFPDLWWSMYSLFEALTGGRDWGEIAGPFIQVHRVLGVFLVLYIFVGIFCILNMLTAVFLDAAQRVDTADHVYAKEDWVNEVRTFIRRAIQNLPEDLRQTSVLPNGTEQNARITKKGFFKLLEIPENKAYLKGNGLDLFLMDQEHLGELFDMMDADGNGHLEVKEFVKAIYDHKGAASSMDLQRALHMIRSLLTQMELTSRKSPRSSSSVHTGTSGLPVAGADF